MKRFILALLCVVLILAGGISAYFYFNGQDDESYKSGMFVDKGDDNGYATMYDILKSL